MWYGINVKNNKFIIDPVDTPETLQEQSLLERKYHYIARSKEGVISIVLSIALDHSKDTVRLMESCKHILTNIKATDE